ncbi:hypothetical protein [Deinococcus kurensis]|uniref:hypothetical protein n=1 Tax=Deinococcus kurensis TaxID=2662757 RepID=UPI0012D2A3A6|nr:hypothetical protein [Deinococcus kurensis]
MQGANHTKAAELPGTFGEILHAAAAANLLRQVHDAVRAGEPARDWATLALLLDPIAARLRASAQEPVTGPVPAVQGGA